MCTVTYVPLSGGDFIFTSNRDEAPQRLAAGLHLAQGVEKTLLFPQDPRAKGTWIAVANTQQMVCVLNGAFEKHRHQPPYRLSRGLMALAFFSYSNASAFVEQFDFQGIEPFTFIIYDQGQLYELRWDEQQTHFKSLATDQAHLWASSTLYDAHWQSKRQEWFEQWQAQQDRIDQAAVLDFHHHAGEGNPEYDVVMNRSNIVRTTSITSLLKTNQGFDLRYEDLLHQSIHQQQLLFS